MNAVVLPKLTSKHSANSSEPLVNTRCEQYTVLALCEGDTVSGVVLLSGFRNMSISGSVTVTLGIQGNAVISRISKMSMMILPEQNDNK